MISGVVYTETYKITLTAVIDNIEKAYGTRSAEKLLDRIDRIVEKIGSITFCVGKINRGGPRRE
jgi:hypothetical protein